MKVNNPDGKCKHSKFLTTCPVCNKKIFLHHILEFQGSLLDSGQYPVPLTMLHGLKPNRHALTLYLDKNFCVRGQTVSELVKVTRK
ncbi:hypothetical protein GF325_18755 [Candidatus Bathyarchaeota archaeon]|nr:hypothetical protein [Candidatus Bathyarchaeota archaeon]